MHAELLFIRRCEQAAELLHSRDEAELLDLAGLLRQMLMDRFSLMDAVNTNRIKAKFHVGASSYAGPDPYEKQTFWTILDGLDPEIRRPGAPSVTLTRQQFLKHVVINAHGNKITIQDVIEYAANVAGGVHFDPRPRPEPIARVNRTVNVKGIEIAMYHLKAIATVVLRALQPLIDDVRARQRT
ncbi:hypothetical protein [Ensifer sp. 22460]|uniref:hypothetical protein n=1 Tax=Ensifer sp. 22460 TaxID=3453922 RepID=UPI003F849041